MKFQGCGQLGLGQSWLSHQPKSALSEHKSQFPSTIVVSKLGHVPWDILVNIEFYDFYLIKHNTKFREIRNSIMGIAESSGGPPYGDPGELVPQFQF